MNNAGKIVYLAHPVRGDVPGNLARARRWVRYVEETYGVIVEASWIVQVEVYGDDDDALRATSLARTVSILERCDEVWLCGGRISHGMEVESAHARQHGIPVVSLVDLGEEPPKAAA